MQVGKHGANRVFRLWLRSVFESHVFSLIDCLTQLTYKSIARPIVISVNVCIRFAIEHILTGENRILLLRSAHSLENHFNRIICLGQFMPFDILDALFGRRFTMRRATFNASFVFGPPFLTAIST